RTDIQEILVDEASVFDRASRFMEQVMPQNVSKLKLYEDSVPLFSRFQIEHQIENAYARTVKLPSGGALVIDHTEALISIDVNSARATKGADIEETALQTNLEAVDELARQMRIRDLGGLLVIDLIDMTSARNKKTVETRLEEAVHNDRARIQIGHISRFGLLEMSRQRLRSSISESNYGVCPLCDGTGQVRHVTSAALSFLRILEEEALKENTEAVLAELPVDIATYLLNEKRHEVNQVESRLGTRIVLIPSPDLQGSQFNIQRLRSEDIDATGNTLESHKIRITPASENELEYSLTHRKTRPAVNVDQIDTPPPPVPNSAPDSAKPDGLGLLTRIWNRLTKGAETPEPEKKPERPPQRRGRPNQSRSRGRRPGGRRDGQRQERKEGSEGGRNRNAQGQANTDRKTQSDADNASGSTSGQKSGQRRSRGGRGRSGGQGPRPNSRNQQQERAAKSSTDSSPAPASAESGKTGTEG
ncbi:MAG: ribonuclease E/G, partial [Acidiferrobacteraceae bacterium]|nr:ribonuclease E/G [Acidiferrobacteraceae bacterium]MBT6786762.1 ribonuclease E/G [Acidiferrobacteraceae bacterium]